MARKIRLTERNLQQIVNRVIKESQLLNEADIDVLCDCGGDCSCWGTYDGDAAHCECCATECKDDSPEMVMMDKPGLSLAERRIIKNYRKSRKR